MRTIAPSLLALAVACGSDPLHDDPGDHGHGHNGDSGEFPAQAVTVWTDNTELFMEYDAFVAGSESRFLAHATVLDGFEPLREGEVSVTVTMTGGAAKTATATAATRPGIFIPAITPEQAGDCSLTVEIRAPTLVDRIDAGPCRVFPNRAAATAAGAGEQDAGGAISFLKEQQWVIEFGTAAVAKRELSPGLRVNAEIRAVPDREARLTAPTDGRLILATPVPILGAMVKKGQLLASILPMMSGSDSHGTLAAEVDGAEAQHASAVAQRDRLARLVRDDAVPRRRLEDAEAAVKVAKAGLDAARSRLARYAASASGSATRTTGAFRVRAPIDGTLVLARVTSGQTVKAGELLFAVIDLDRVWVIGQVFEADLPKLEGAGAAWFQVEGRDEVFDIGEATGRLVTIGSVIDPKTRTVPVVFEVDNTSRVLRVGQFATLTVATGAPVTTPAVPASALLQEGGQWIAYVQTAGESFERRVVQVGIQSRGWVEVQSSLSEGERVVTAGAYDVKLAASAGGAPAHGHSH